MPEASRLALLRQDIDQNSTGLKAVLRNAGLRREFFKGIPDDEHKAVKAFIGQNQESALKTKPKVRFLIRLFVYQFPPAFLHLRLPSWQFAFVIVNAAWKGFISALSSFYTGKVRQRDDICPWCQILHYGTIVSAKTVLTTSTFSASHW